MTIGTIKTLEFLTPFIGSPETRFLEVGCGRGELTSILSRRIKTTGIDSSEDAVIAAMQRGVNAVVADFLQYGDQPFDIVFFSRSLHHIHPLNEAIAKATDLVSDGGRLIIEDFAAELADRPTIQWYFDTRAQLAKLGLLRAEAGLHNVHAFKDPVDWWNHHHFVSHQVSTSVQMLDALSQSFQIDEQCFVPYMYRYLVSDLLDGVDNTDVEQAIFEDEARLCKQNQTRSIGYRVVSTKNNRSS